MLRLPLILQVARFSSLSLVLPSLPACRWVGVGVLRWGLLLRARELERRGKGRS